MTSKQLILVLVILIGIGIIFTVGRLFMNQPISVIPTPTPTPTQTATATPVPTNTSGNTFIAAIAEKVGPSSLTVTPLKVVEDSRCPADVQCIQAGTVRVEAQVASTGSITTSAFALNKPITIGSHTVTLTKVTPIKYAGRPIAAGEYRFTFEIK